MLKFSWENVFEADSEPIQHCFELVQCEMMFSSL